ncbi:hypothetical protein FB451DRAFT_1162589 [Mycena latifolia]|nr:hypothetical protein FB451DRAFT_1162589 [Mycena latifolia]
MGVGEDSSLLVGEARWRDAMRRDALRRRRAIGVRWRGGEEGERGRCVKREAWKRHTCGVAPTPTPSFNTSPAASASFSHPTPPDSDYSPDSAPSPRRRRTQTRASAAGPRTSGSAPAAVVYTARRPAVVVRR